jgi:hypothetical protein
VRLLRLRWRSRRREWRWVRRRGLRELELFWRVCSSFCVDLSLAYWTRLIYICIEQFLLFPFSPYFSENSCFLAPKPCCCLPDLTASESLSLVPVFREKGGNLQMCTDSLRSPFITEVDCFTPAGEGYRHRELRKEYSSVREKTRAGRER